MKYIRQACVIFGITMIGEFLNYALPLPIPGGVLWAVFDADCFMYRSYKVK